MTNELEQIGFRLLKFYPRDWVYQVMTAAETREAFRFLLEMWRDAASEGERNEVVEDLQALLDDQEHPAHAPALGDRREADAVVERRRAQKAHLRKLIDERGGISEVARRANMPQPSLSRLLNSGSEPRPSTLVKLAAALGVSVSRLFPGEEGQVIHLGTQPYRRRLVGGAVAYGRRG